MIHNPILPVFHTDPCACRKGEDYYAACSSFEWFPGIPVYLSRDLKHWELYTHILTDENLLNLAGLPSAKGIWVPCLTYCEADNLFYAVYGVMRSMNARYFDIDNFLITAPDIIGLWSERIYLNSAGFDAALYHGEDGRKWLLSLQWETRDGYRKPDAICLAEYSPEKKRLLGYPKPIAYGSTSRGFWNIPQINLSQILQRKIVIRTFLKEIFGIIFYTLYSFIFFNRFYFYSIGKLSLRHSAPEDVKSLLQ